MASYFYDLPFFSKSSGFRAALLRGWVVGGIVTFQSGRPFTVVDSAGGSAFTPIGPDQSTADIAPGSNVSSAVTHGSIQSRLDAYLSAAAFQPVPHLYPTLCDPVNNFNFCTTAYGNLGRNIFRGPFQQNWDFSVGKIFSLTERQKFEFRSEFFNLWNHPSFNNPSFVDVSGPNFGAITTTVGTPRLIQFVARYSF